MKKLLISSAVAAAIVIPASAFAGTSLYGDLRWSVADKDDDGAGINDTQYVNNNTRIGLKGSYDGGNGMSAFFHTQIGLNSQDNSAFNSQAFTNRFAFAGIKGGFGKVMYGTVSSAYKMAGLKIDPFYDTSAITANMGTGNGGASHGFSSYNNGFINNTIAYVTPKMSGFSANVYFFGEDNNSKGSDDHINYGISYAGMGAKATVQFIDTGSDDADAVRFVASYKMSALNLGVSFEQLDNQNGAGNDQDNIVLSARYDINPKLQLAATWGDQDADGGDLASDGSAFNLGVFYKLFDKTQIRLTCGDADSDLAGNDASVISLGVSQKFSM